MNCPLCNAEIIDVLEKISVKKLLILYKKFTNTDFSYLLKNDIEFCECQKCKLRFYHPLITGDEKFYNSLQKFEWYYRDEPEEFHVSKKYIKPGDSVLEVGSGKGAFAKLMSSNKYLGLDFSSNAKKLALENGINIENESIQDFSKKHPESFDVVCSFQVLEHVSDPKEFIEAKIKALKKGGKLIIAVPSEDSYLKYLTNGILNMPPHHVTRWKDETLKFIAGEYNLDLIDLIHEKVQDVHKLYFLNQLVRNSFKNSKMIDVSLRGKIISLVAGGLSKFLLKGLKDEMLPNNGHTVMAIYVKR